MTEPKQTKVWVVTEYNLCDCDLDTEGTLVVMICATEQLAKQEAEKRGLNYHSETVATKMREY